MKACLYGFFGVVLLYAGFLLAGAAHTANGMDSEVAFWSAIINGAVVGLSVLLAAVYRFRHWARALALTLLPLGAYTGGLYGALAALLLALGVFLFSLAFVGLKGVESDSDSASDSDPASD